MKPTRREWHVIALMFIIPLVSSLFNQDTLKNMELLYLLFVVLPIGIYIITDPEKRKVE